MRTQKEIPLNEPFENPALVRDVRRLARQLSAPMPDDIRIYKLLAAWNNRKRRQAGTWNSFLIWCAEELKAIPWPDDIEKWEVGYKPMDEFLKAANEQYAREPG